MDGALITLINGAPSEHVFVADRGLQYGDGLFETMLFRHGHICLFQLHKDRLLKGAGALKIDIDLGRLGNDLGVVCQRLSALNCVESTLKLIVTRGISGRGYRTSTNSQSTIIISAFARHSPDVSWAAGVDVTICNTRLSEQPLLAGVKHLNRLDSVLARSEWSSEFHEGLICDQHENIVEGTMSNVFFLQDNMLITPRIDRCGVAGVIRRCVIEHLAPALGVRVEVQAVPASGLQNITSGFLTNALIGIAPIKTLAGRALVIPELFGALQVALDEYRERST